jgi:hypothetical protein
MVIVSVCLRPLYRQVEILPIRVNYVAITVIPLIIPVVYVTFCVLNGKERRVVD